MDLEKRKRMAVESILENESLRHGMEDDGAEALLEWGTTCAKQIAAATAELEDDIDAEESAYPRMRALRGLLGAAQKLASASHDPDAQDELINELARHAAIIYNKETPSLPVSQQNIASVLQNGSAGEKIRILRTMIEQETN